MDQCNIDPYEDEIKDLGMAISGINLHGDGYGFLPKELLLALFTSIDHEYPWQTIRFIHELCKVCKKWYVVIIKNPETIRTMLNIRPLCWAAALGQADRIIELKLKHGFSLREPDKRGLRPADYAIGNGHINCLMVFRAGGALETPNRGIKEFKEYAQDGDEQTMYFLMAANTVHTTEEQPEEQADEQDYACEALTQAVKDDDYDKVLLILTKHPQCTVAISDGWMKDGTLIGSKMQLLLVFNEQAYHEHFLFDDLGTFLDYSNSDIELFFKNFRRFRANPNTLDDSGMALLHCPCVSSRFLPVIKELLACENIDPNIRCLNFKEDQGDVRDGWTPLHWAACYGADDCLQELLNVKNCDVNIANDKGETPLKLAIKNGETNCAKLLKNHGATIFDTSSWTRLHLAAYDGKYETLKKLLCQTDCNVNIATDDANGLTPLHCVAMSGNQDCAKLLVQHGAAVDAVSKQGKKPFEYAIGHEDIGKCHVFLFREYMKNKQPESNRGLTIRKGIPLHHAAYNGEYETLKKLLSSDRCNVDMVDEEGRTALHCAAAGGHIDCIKLLLNAGACVMKEDKNGLIPMKYAIKAKQQEAVIELLTPTSSNLNNQMRDPKKVTGKKRNTPRDKQPDEKCTIQ